MYTNKLMGDHESKFIRFLSRPDSYRHNPADVQLIQTHISLVAVAPPFVFKVKKNIKLPFLDYSTVEKRKYYIEREIRLNKRLCTGVYLKEVPIYIKNGRLSFQPAGKIYDYALKMNYMPPEQSLPEIIRKGHFGGHLQNLLIKKLFHFYESQKSLPSVKEAGVFHNIERLLLHNIGECRRYKGKVISPTAFNTIEAYTKLFLKYNKKLISSRVKQNAIVDGHGDLRPEHIYFLKKGVQIYDCIEFNDQFRFLDIVNDIAFLAMELDVLGLPETGKKIAEKILHKLNDKNGYELLNFYKLYRAMVRVKVNSILAREGEVNQSKRDNALFNAMKLMQMSLRYALFENRPVVLVVMGKTGCGKSFVADKLSNDMGYPVLSTDIIRKTGANINIYSATPSALKKKIYSPSYSRKVYHEIILRTKAVLKEGSGVILDGTFSKKKYRHNLMSSLCKYPVYFIELNALDKISARRLKLRDKKKTISDARLEDKAIIDTLYEPPLELTSENLFSVQNDNNLEKTVAEIYHYFLEKNFLKDKSIRQSA